MICSCFRVQSITYHQERDLVSSNTHTHRGSINMFFSIIRYILQINVNTVSNACPLKTLKIFLAKREYILESQQSVDFEPSGLLQQHLITSNFTINYLQVLLAPSKSHLLSQKNRKEYYYWLKLMYLLT